jgi:hypothetical protein
MNFTMTLREALKIQADQIGWYGKYRSDLAAVVASMTDVSGCDLDTPMDVIEVNKRVPRGGAIEHICGLSYSAQD